MQIFIHIGLPRTGSSLLRKEIFKENSNIYYPGLRNGDKEFDTFITQKIVWQEECKFDVSEIKSFFKNKLKFEKKKICLISSVGLSSMVPTDRKIIAKRLKTIFPKAKIILCIREQKDWIESMYFEMREMKNLSNLNDNIFIKNKNISISEWFEYRKKIEHFIPLMRQLDFWPLVKIYTDFFGKENTNVLVYEELKKNPRNYFKKLYKILGININEENNLKFNSVNKKVYKDRLFIENIKRRFPNSKYLKKVIPPQIIRFFMNKIFNDHTNKLKREQIDWINKFCKYGNREINKNFKLKLKNYNYSL